MTRKEWIIAIIGFAIIAYLIGSIAYGIYQYQTVPCDRFEGEKPMRCAEIGD